MGLNLFSRPWRWAKTLFFVAAMIASLLLDCAPPLLVVLLDLFLPSALLAAAGGGPPSSTPALASQLRSYQFRASLVDLPLLSAARSLLLLCFYLFWSGRGPYLGVATTCAVSSAGYVSLKAISIFGAAAAPGKRHLLSFGEKEGPAVDALFLSSLALAMAHVVAAYRTSCRERRKMLVYKIDIEAEAIPPLGIAGGDPHPPWGSQEAIPPWGSRRWRSLGDRSLGIADEATLRQ